MYLSHGYSVDGWGEWHSVSVVASKLGVAETEVSTKRVSPFIHLHSGGREEEGGREGGGRERGRREGEGGGERERERERRG